jgi:hypothetical protein
VRRDCRTSVALQRFAMALVSSAVRFMLLPKVSTVFTINARGNIMLEVMRDYFSLDNAQMHREIRLMHSETVRLLKDKGVDYQKLGKALVPSTEKFEAAFIFDSQKITSGWYGLTVCELILPLLEKSSVCSVLCGDLLGKDQDFIFKIFCEHLVYQKSFEFKHATLLYCVYINNLSAAALNKINNGLVAHPAYVGYFPTTFQTIAKKYLSTTLVNVYVKAGDIIIQGHEDDRAEHENINMVGYPFEKYGYKCISIQSSSFSIFLSYKVEREVFGEFVSDTEMALNTISNRVVQLTDCEIQLDDSKFDYLQREKRGKLNKAGVANLSAIELAKLIKAKVSDSYIYNLTIRGDENVLKFNLILEIPRKGGGYPTKILAAMEYKPNTKLLRVITLT